MNFRNGSQNTFGVTEEMKLIAYKSYVKGVYNLFQLTLFQYPKRKCGYLTQEYNFTALTRIKQTKNQIIIKCTTKVKFEYQFKYYL